MSLFLLYCITIQGTILEGYVIFSIVFFFSLKKRNKTERNHGLLGGKTGIFGSETLNCDLDIFSPLVF